MDRGRVLESIRQRLTYANVVATLALFAAVGGGLAWALERNIVRSRHIAAGQVKTQDIGDAQVRTEDIGNGEVRSADIGTAQVTDEELPDATFTALSPANGWQPAGGGHAAPGAFKDGYGFVHLRGAVNQPSSAGGVMFTLPQQFRPPNFIIVPASCGTLGSVSATLVIATDGDVTISPDIDGSLTTENLSNICESGYVSLEGVSFRSG